MVLEIALSTNCDFQNYSNRIPDINEYFFDNNGVFGVEFFVLPDNLPGKGYGVDFPNNGFFNGVPVLSDCLADSVSSVLVDNDVRLLQFHFPWQNTVIDYSGYAFKHLIYFAKLVMGDCPDLERVSINCHVGMHKFSDEFMSSKSGIVRKRLQDSLVERSFFANQYVDELGFNGLLFAENNSARSGDFDYCLGLMTYDAFDLVPEDVIPYVERSSFNGLTLDLPHAQSVVHEVNRDCANIDWMLKSYDGGVNFSLSDFLKKCSNFTKWFHVSDERNGVHNGDHASPAGACYLDDDVLIETNSSIMDFDNIFSLLRKYFSGVLPMIIETKDGYQSNGFDLIKRLDYPFFRDKLLEKDIFFEW